MSIIWDLLGSNLIMFSSVFMICFYQQIERFLLVTLLLGSWEIQVPIILPLFLILAMWLELMLNEVITALSSSSSSPMVWVGWNVVFMVSIKENIWSKDYFISTFKKSISLLLFSLSFFDISAIFWIFDHFFSIFYTFFNKKLFMFSLSSSSLFPFTQLFFFFMWLRSFSVLKKAPLFFSL